MSDKFIKTPGIKHERRSIELKTNINSKSYCINMVNMKQDFEMMEVLTVIDKSKSHRIHCLIRSWAVLANDALVFQMLKVSIFIPQR